MSCPPSDPALGERGFSRFSRLWANRGIRTKTKRESRAPNSFSSDGLAGSGERRTKSAIRNQVRIADSGSLLPLWEKARMRVSPRLRAALRAGRPRSQGRPLTGDGYDEGAARNHCCRIAPNCIRRLSGFPLSRE